MKVYIPKFKGYSNGKVWFLATHFFKTWLKAERVEQDPTRAKAAAINFRAAIDELVRRGFHKDQLLNAIEKI